MACQWQRRLRHDCIASRISDLDITHDATYDWRRLLRCEKRLFAEQIVGPGIVRVTFRIIEGERDTNYTNFDGHGRHVFEFVRAAGSVYRVHYHKDGKTDPPSYVGPDQVVLPGLQYSTIQAGGAPQPAGGAAQGPATAASGTSSSTPTREWQPRSGATQPA